MTEKLKKIIKEESVRLPKEAQEVIITSDWEKISEEIGRNHFLNENEINQLQVEISLVLLGIVEQDYFSLNIENRVGTSKNEAEKIAEEVDQKIFKPMYDLLTKNIKDTLKIRNIHWRQNLDFILSGGDYTAFIRRVEPVESRKLKVESNPSKVPAHPHEGAGGDDLKSKFTI